MLLFINFNLRVCLFLIIVVISALMVFNFILVFDNCNVFRYLVLLTTVAKIQFHGCIMKLTKVTFSQKIH